MKFRPFVIRATAAWLLAAHAALTGCASLSGDYRSAEMEQREDFLLLQEDIQRLKGRLEGIELELDRLRRDVDTVRTQQPRGTEAAIQSLQTAVSALEARIRAVDSAREKDKQEIVNQLSGKISQIVSSSASARSKPSGSSAPKRKVSDEGYEHVVQPGETLSAIAAAYSVRSSDIITANDLQNPDQLRAGQKLFIPAP